MVWLGLSLSRRVRTVVGVISTHAADLAAAKARLQYLASPEAEVLWKEAGYEPHK
jgi:ABC-type Fe3+ transport system substrate-binding protein